MTAQHHPTKGEFQLERILFFSDAIFAIAITLLIIELKVPELADNATNADFWKAMAAIAPKIVGFVLSFFIIAMYWFVHHEMFGYVTRYTGKLIWLNLIFMFTIVAMPYTTAMYSEFSNVHHLHLSSPYAIYAGNIIATGVINYLLWRYIGDPANGVAEGFPDNHVLAGKWRALVMPLVFGLSWLVSLQWPVVGRFTLFLIAPLMMWVPFAKKSKTDS